MYLYSILYFSLSDLINLSYFTTFLNIIITLENFLAFYLYHDPDDKWWVEGWLHNPSPSKSLPTSGWQYFDHTSMAYKDDPTLTISPGPLPPLPRQFTVTATGAAAEMWPECPGVFTRTQRWCMGGQSTRTPRGGNCIIVLVTVAG